MVTEIPSPTIIAEGTQAQGTFNFQSGTQVFGSIDGELIQESLEPLQVGKSGWVHGAIESRGPVMVEGRVEGSIRSETKIKLFPTATVNGTLDAPSIEVLPGALFEGDLKMKLPAPRLDAVPAAA